MEDANTGELFRRGPAFSLALIIALCLFSAPAISTAEEQSSPLDLDEACQRFREQRLWDELLQTATRHAALEPDRVAHTVRMAEALMELGDESGALDRLEDAVRLGLADVGLLNERFGRLAPNPRFQAIAGDAARALATVNREWRARQYGAKDGLIDNNPRSVQQLRDGRIAIGSENGLVLFDGARFETYSHFSEPSIAGDYLYGVAEDDRGRIWIGSWDDTRDPNVSGGLFVLEQNTIRRLFADGPHQAIAGSVKAVAHSSGSVFVGGRDGVLEIRGEQVTAWGVDDGLPAGQVLGLLAEEDVIWVGSEGGLVRIGRESGGEAVSVFKELGGVRCFTPVRLRSGVLAVPTDKGLYLLAEGRFTRLGRDDGLPSDQVVCLAEDQRGTLWIGTTRGLVVRSEGRTALIEAVIEQSGEPAKIEAIVVTERGSVWAAVRLGGVYAVEERSMVAFGRESGIEGPLVKSVAFAPDGNLVVARRSGEISIWDKQAARVRREAKIDADHEIKKFCGLGGDDLLVTLRNRELRLFNPETGRTSDIDIEMPDGGCSSMYPEIDRQGGFFLGTFSCGLLHWKDGKTTHWGLDAGLTTVQTSNVMLDRSGVLWTKGAGGMTRFDGDEFTLMPLVRDGVECVSWNYAEDLEGTLWVGTWGCGLFKKTATGRPEPDDQLDRGVVTALVPGVDGDMWMVVWGQGVFLAHRSGELVEPLVGLHDYSSELVVLTADEDGAVWFADAERLFRFMYQEQDLEPPRPIIASITAASAQLPVIRPLVVAHDENDIEILYAGIWWRDENKVRFRTRMVGLDDDWSPVTDRADVRYRNLPPGRYRFEVTARNGYGIWSPEPATISVRVLPPWWETWWFRGLAVLAALAMMSLVVWWQVRKYRRRKDREVAQQLDAAERERIDKDLALGREIQTGLLPAEAPQLDGFELAGKSLPAREVGGDFFTYVPLEGGGLGVAVGDVSGKSVPGALYMAVSSSLVEAEARRFGDPAEMLGALNQRLHERLKRRRMFVALLYAILDPQDRTVRLACAGQVPPLLVRGDGDAGFLEARGLPIGGMKSAVYRNTEVSLAVGDSLVLLSDGVVEAESPDGEIYGFERLEKLLSEGDQNRACAATLERILDDVNRFSEGGEQLDDVTVVVIQAAEKRA